MLLGGNQQSVHGYCFIRSVGFLAWEGPHRVQQLITTAAAKCTGKPKYEFRINRHVALVSVTALSSVGERVNRE